MTTHTALDEIEAQAVWFADHGLPDIARWVRRMARERDTAIRERDVLRAEIEKLATKIEGKV